MCLLYAVVLILLLFYFSLWVYLKTTAGVCRSQRDLTGLTVIVTGSNTGIGLETARGLASRNARIVLACRSIAKGEKAAKDIIQSTGNINVAVKQLDLSSFSSVREFATDILQNEERVDVLINNAGVMVPSGSKSADGLELTMATNHFGPFLLTNLLLPLLKRSATSRIVVVSSDLYTWANVDSLEGDKPLGMYQSYYNSKLANIFFALELSKRLAGTGVTVNTLHPGAVRTDLARDMKQPFKLLFVVFASPFLKSAVQGAQTSIYAAVSEELDGVSGKYFLDCREHPLKEIALDEKAAKKLWEISEKITELNTS